MSGPSFTTEEKLAGVEHLIEIMRWARSNPGTPEHHSRELLKAIARDLRAQLHGAPLRTMNSLEYRVETARRQKARIGYCEISVLQSIGEDVLADWPVLRRALEAMESGQ